MSVLIEVIAPPVGVTGGHPARQAVGGRAHRAGDPALRGRSTRFWIIVIAAGYLLQAGVRFWWSWGVDFPRADPDEIGYLIAARSLSGGAPADLTGSTFYQAGYPLLLVPAYWFGHTPQTVYRIAVGENALINALVFPLAYLAGRRLGVRREWALPLGFTTALLPAVVFYSQYVLADTVMPVIVLAWLLTCHTWLTPRPSAHAGGAGSVARAGAAGFGSHAGAGRSVLRGGAAGYVPRAGGAGSVARGGAAGFGSRAGAGRSVLRAAAGRVALLAGVGSSLLAGYAYAVHTRGDVIVAVQAGLIVVAALRRWVPRRSALASAVALAATCGTATLLNNWLLALDYPRGARDLGGLLSQRLLDAGGQERTVAGAAGQLWYQICATWGIAGIGVIVLLAVALRGAGARDRADRVLAAMTLLTVAAVAYASSAALPDEHRIGNYLYGRYLACLAPILFLVAVVALRRLGRRAVIMLAAGSLALALVTGGVAWAYAGDRIYDYLYIGFDFPEYGLLNGGWAHPAHLHAMLVAFVLLAVVIAALMLRRGRPVALTLLLAINVVAVDRCSSGWHGHPITDTVIEDAGLHAPQILAVDWNVPWTFYFPLEYSEWWSRIRFIHAMVPLTVNASAAVIAWPPHTSPECSWPAAPPGWHVAGAHRSGPTAWVTWTKNPPRKGVSTTPSAPERCNERGARSTGAGKR